MANDTTPPTGRFERRINDPHAEPPTPWEPITEAEARAGLADAFRRTGVDEVLDEMIRYGPIAYTPAAYYRFVPDPTA
jgi:hypothetical protein